MRTLLFLVIVLLSCSRGSVNESPDPADGPDKVVTSFYQWYLDNYYNQDHKIVTPNEKVEDGKLFLDTTAYMSLIRNCGYFSQKYILAQVDMVAACDAAIRELELSRYEECGCSPADLVGNCNFMNYYNWLYHQGEDTEDILVKETKINGKTAMVDIGLLSKKGDKKDWQTLRVTLDQEVHEWKISDITTVIARD